MLSHSSEEPLVPFHPPLPVELIREVIEHVALTDKSSTPSLALVSRNFYTWVTPLMYHTVTLDTRERMLFFIDGIEVAQCASVDNTRYIVSLAIHSKAMQRCDWILSLCGNVQSLLLWPRCDQSELSWQAPEGAALWSHPWHVVILVVYPMWLAQRILLFTHTTHLYLDEALDPQTLQLCLQMPALTHICFGVYGDHDHPEVVVRGTKFLLDMPSIEQVLIHAFISGVPIGDFFGLVWASLAEIPDRRLFVKPGLYREDFFERFEAGETVWDSVEEWEDWRRVAQAGEL
ncbi:hypothetical protein JB92DRAFT_1615781 [Gautieria morchelliformis]|nr:hypothetical protein JB92DRAFT_1615781 [Gautieria morchelliformis]